MEGIQENQNIREVAGPAPADKKLGLGNVYCKMGEGWTCVITKTEGPDAGKVFLKCGENCECTIDGETVSKELKLAGDVEIGSGNQAFCKCGEGWSCVIYKTDAASGEGFAECAANCSCSTQGN